MRQFTKCSFTGSMLRPVFRKERVFRALQKLVLMDETTNGKILNGESLQHVPLLQQLTYLDISKTPLATSELCQVREPACDIVMHVCVLAVRHKERRSARQPNRQLLWLACPATHVHVGHIELKGNFHLPLTT